MESSDSFWVNLFSWVALVGALLVIVGVVLESVELSIKWAKIRKFRIRIGEVFGRHRRLKVALLSKYLETRILKFETLGFALLFIGLAIELFGSMEAENRQSDINSKLAFKTELLHSNNLALQIKLQPRIITQRQISDFIFLTEKIAKVSISIGIGETRDEPFNYAKEIKFMLKQAGFGTPSSDGVWTSGIQIHPGLLFFGSKDGQTDPWDDICLCCGPGNGSESYKFNFEITNGFTRPIVFPTQVGDTNIVYNALAFCFSQIHIPCGVERSSWLNTNQSVFIIRQKPQ